jgi:hypothetical protein
MGNEYEPALKHELDPPASVPLETTFYGGSNYCFKRGIVEYTFDIEKGTQNHLCMFEVFLQSFSNVERAVSVDVPALYAH